MSLRANFHTHTNMCDGSNTAEEMVEQALALDFTHIGFSGHMDQDIHMNVDAYYREIHRLQKKYEGQIEILCGIELDTLYDPACAAQADYTIGSTHFLDVPTEVPVPVDYEEEKIGELCRQFFDGDYYKMARAYYELEATVYDRLHCTFVGHFDLLTRFNDSLHFLDETDPRYRKPALEAMEYLVSRGVPFEINCGAVNRNRKKEFYPNFYLLRKLSEMGGEIFINSDAHQKELLCGGFDHAVKMAIECGFQYVNYLTRGTDGNVEIRQWPLDLL